MMTAVQFTRRTVVQLKGTMMNENVHSKDRRHPAHRAPDPSLPADAHQLETEPFSARPSEPSIDPDSPRHLAEEIMDSPHGPTRYDAGTGRGTVSGPPYGEKFQDRPILDGSTQSAAFEASVPNPTRGQSDPAAMKRQPALNNTSTNRWLLFSTIAVLVVVAALLLLARWNPLWCGIGVIFACLSLLSMLVVRASPAKLRTRLRIEATIMALIWLVPLSIIVTTLITFADEIWP